MCRSIKTLRPPYADVVTDEDMRAAALQYVRKISGFRAPAARRSVLIPGDRGVAVRVQSDGRDTRVRRDQVRGLFKLDELVTAKYPIEDWETAVHDLHDGKLARGVLTLTNV